MTRVVLHSRMIELAGHYHNDVADDGCDDKSVEDDAVGWDGQGFEGEDDDDDDGDDAESVAILCSS